MGVVFEVHPGGELGLGICEEVGGGAEAAGLAEGVEILGPPDWVPDLEVLEPVAVVDGARVGSVPGLVQVDTLGSFGVGGVGEDGGALVGGVIDGVIDGIVEDSGGDAVEDANGVGGRCWNFVVGDDGEGRADGGDWIKDAFDVAGRRGDSRLFRHHSDQGCECGEVDCGSLREVTIAERLDSSGVGCGNIECSGLQV